MAITISGENNNDKILAQDGVIDQISGINIVGLITASHINVGSNIQLGNAGIITATTFVGNVTGNVNSTSPLLLQTGGSERFRITGNNELGIAGANYGSAGQVLTSGGSGSAVTWSAIPSQVTISNNADNRVITGGSGTNLNGEANLTFDGSTLVIAGAATLGNGSGLNWGDTSARIRGESGASGLLRFDTNGGERLRIDSNGLMGLGVTPTSHNNTTAFQIYDDYNSQGYPRIRLTNQSSGTASSDGYEIVLNGSDLDAVHRLRENADIYFMTNNLERLRINANGSIQITPEGSTGNPYMLIDTSGDSVRFSAKKSSGNNEFRFLTQSSGTVAERLRITSDGFIQYAPSNMQIFADSSDGSDDHYLNLSGGGACSQGRGAQVVMYGNEKSSEQGRLLLMAGNSGNANGTIDFYCGGNKKATITPEGQFELTGTNSGNHMTSFGTNVGGLTIDDVGNQHTALEVTHGSNKAYLVASSNNSVYVSSYGTGNFILEHTGGGGTRERLRITSAGDILINNTLGGAEAINLVGNGGGILISRAESGVPNDGQTLADIGLNSYASSQTCSSADVLIRGQADGNHSGTSAGSALLLFTKPSATGPGSAPTERFRIDRNGKIGINNNSPECRGGGIDMSSNVGTSGKSFADLRAESQLIIRNPSTNHHSFTQLLFENGGGTSAATMFRHRLGSSQGSLQNFVGDMCLFRRTGNAGSGAADYRESTRWCGANEQARQVWWASGDSDTSNTNRLGWHHLSAQRDHPGTDAYSFFRLETGAASYARQGMGKYTCVWTTGHASGYGLATGHFGYYMHHGNSRIYVNEHIIYRERYSNGSYYGWDDGPNLRICNSTDSGGTNACIVFRCGGRRYSGGYDMSVIVGLFVDLYVPESANGDTNPRLYVAGNSQSNLDGGGFGSPVNHDYVSFTSSNPNHSGQP